MTIKNLIVSVSIAAAFTVPGSVMAEGVAAGKKDMADKAKEMATDKAKEMADKAMEAVDGAKEQGMDAAGGMKDKASEAAKY